LIQALNEIYRRNADINQALACVIASYANIRLSDKEPNFKFAFRLRTVLSSDAEAHNETQYKTLGVILSDIVNTISTAKKTLEEFSKQRQISEVDRIVDLAYFRHQKDPLNTQETVRSPSLSSPLSSFGGIIGF